MKRALLAAIFVGLAMTDPSTATEETDYRLLEFAELDGWEEDDHQAALDVFLTTCRDMKSPDWRALCKAAASQTNAKTFFELFFRPVEIDDGKEALFTGYFEPELEGDTKPSSRYRYPLYRMPPEARTNRPWLSRREMEENGAMKNRGLEIVWVDD